MPSNGRWDLIRRLKVKDKRAGGPQVLGPSLGTFPDLVDVKSKAHSAVAEGLKLPSGYAATLVV